MSHGDIFKCHGFPEVPMLFLPSGWTTDTVLTAIIKSLQILVNTISEETEKPAALYKYNRDSGPEKTGSDGLVMPAGEGKDMSDKKQVPAGREVTGQQKAALRG